MVLSAVSVLVAVQLSSDFPEGFMNYPVLMLLENVTGIKSIIFCKKNNVFHNSFLHTSKAIRGI